MKSMYGAVDRKDTKEDGKIGSYSPAWGQKKNIVDFNEEISRLERDMISRVIPSEERGTVENEIIHLKERMNNIVNSKPNYSQSEEKFLLEQLQSLNTQVSKTLYSEYEQEQPGKYADPQREANINDFADIAKIEVNKEVAEACNIDPNKMINIGSSNNVQISRNNADKIRRLACDYFDIPEYNREYLRSKNFEGRKAQVSMSSISPEKYNQAFGNGNNEVTKLREEVANLRTLIEEKKKSKKGTTAKVIEWKCEEEGCGFVGTNKNKGIHKALHVRQAKKKARELAETRA